MVLNRNPNNYFAEVEQIAFSPAHFIPGVEASPDKMLQVRGYKWIVHYIQLPQVSKSTDGFDLALCSNPVVLLYIYLFATYIVYTINDCYLFYIGKYSNSKM